MYIYILTFDPFLLFLDEKIADRQTDNSSNSLIQSRSFIQGIFNFSE